MREILFRGKSIDTGDWIYGYLYKNHLIHHHITGDKYICKESTIGQYTGLRDKDDCKIFEGDSLFQKDDLIGYVVFNNGCFKIDDGETNHAHAILVQDRSKKMEVIGNIHQ